MAVKTKIADVASRLDAARIDLGGAEQRIAEIEQAEDDALDTAEAHAVWMSFGLQY